MEETWGQFIDTDISDYLLKKKRDDIPNESPKARYKRYDGNDNDNDNHDDDDEYDIDNEKYCENVFYWCGFCINVIAIASVCAYMYNN